MYLKIKLLLGVRVMYDWKHTTWEVKWGGGLFLHPPGPHSETQSQKIGIGV